MTDDEKRAYAEYIIYGAIDEAQDEWMGLFEAFDHFMYTRTGQWGHEISEDDAEAVRTLVTTAKVAVSWND